MINIEERSTEKRSFFSRLVVIYIFFISVNFWIISSKKGLIPLHNNEKCIEYYNLLFSTYLI